MRYAKMPDEPIGPPVLEAETPVTRRPMAENARSRLPHRNDSDHSDDSEDEERERKFNDLNEQVTFL